MNRKNIGILVLLTATAVAAAGLFPGCGAPPTPDTPLQVDTAERLRGRDFVELGEFTAVTGTLKPDRGEWFLIDGGNTYEIHLGDHAHREKTGINMAEGKKATARGFLYEQEGAGEIDIAVCTLEIDGREYRFREDDGTPLWRGHRSGDGPGTHESWQTGEDRGAGQRR